MKKLFVAFAIFALAAIALAQTPTGQPGMSAQQPQPTMPGQSQPAAPGQTARPDTPPQAGTTAQPGTTQPSPSSVPTVSPADELAQRLTQALNLNPGQTEQVRSALQDEHKQLMALRDDPGMSPQDKQTKLMDIRRTASNRVMSALTPEQQKKLVDLMQKQHQQNQPPQQQTPSSPPR